jgi:hypothetical protein
MQWLGNSSYGRDILATELIESNPYYDLGRKIPEEGTSHAKAMK